MWGEVISVSRMDAVISARVTGLPLGTNGRPLAMKPGRNGRRPLSNLGEQGRHGRSSHCLISIS